MILDTNAISALIGGDPQLEAVLEASLRHHLPVIALGEFTVSRLFAATTWTVSAEAGVSPKAVR